MKVAVAVVRRGDRVLIARRPLDKHQGGLLEFPGGKIEPGETVAAALVREIAEETGLLLEPANVIPLITVRHDYGDKQVALFVAECQSDSGEPFGLEGQEIGWRNPLELVADDFPAANRPILQAIRLPSRYLVTGAVDKVSQLEQALERVEASSVTGRRLVLVRNPTLASADYEALIRSAVESERMATQSVEFMVHGLSALKMEVMNSPRVVGVHLPWRDAAGLSERPVGHDKLLAVSCHSQSELDHAAAIGADFVTLGPVRPTLSHPDSPGMGIDRFRALCDQARLPVYGLGGLTFEDFIDIRQAGGQGVAAISAWWPTKFSE